MRNYSVVKKNLLEDFFQCVFEEKIKNFIESLDLAIPPKVNRSLSEGEYFLQKEFNKFYPGSSNLVSDILINNLPSINSEIPFIQKQAYRITTSWVSEYVNKINLHLCKKHKIKIETYEELTKIMNKENQEKKISHEQISCLIQNWVNNILQNRTEFNIEEISPFLISLFGYLSSR